MIYPERRLWSAVILQAIHDLLGRSYKDQRHALVWIFYNDPDYFKVCNYANIDPMHVRKKAFYKIING